MRLEVGHDDGGVAVGGGVRHVFVIALIDGGFDDDARGGLVCGDGGNIPRDDLALDGRASVNLRSRGWRRAHEGEPRAERVGDGARGQQARASVATRQLVVDRLAGVDRRVAERVIACGVGVGDLRQTGVARIEPCSRVEEALRRVLDGAGDGGRGGAGGSHGAGCVEGSSGNARERKRGTGLVICGCISADRLIREVFAVVLGERIVRRGKMP